MISSAIVGAALAGCQNMPALPLDSLKAALPQAKPAAPSQLQGILAESANGEWPRVALAIAALHPTAYSNMVLSWGNQVHGDACMRVSAVVWTDPKTSRTIPEETFCPRQIPPQMAMRFNSSLQLLAWSTTYAVNYPVKRPDTGKARTNGPNPPELLFPPGLDFKGFLDGQGGAVFAALVRYMGFDLTTPAPEQNRRLWIVSLPSEYEVKSGQKVVR